MAVFRFILVTVLSLIIFGGSTASVTEKTPNTTDPEGVTYLMDPDKEMENRTITKNFTTTLVVTLMRTSLLYIYLVMAIYYVILMEAEDLLSRFMAVVGKFTVVITVGTYVISEYFLPTAEIYLVITRLAIILFVLSSLQIVHLGICMWQTYISWSDIVDTLNKYWKKIRNLFQKKPLLTPVQDTTTV